eukprot:8059610-Ditylum_brightwellii.AAC.1
MSGNKFSLQQRRIERKEDISSKGATLRHRYHSYPEKKNKDHPTTSSQKGEVRQVDDNDDRDPTNTTPPIPPPSLPQIEKSYNISCDGFDLIVVDDSHRHFAGVQDLIELSLGGIQFSRAAAATTETTTEGEGNKEDKSRSKDSKGSKDNYQNQHQHPFVKESVITCLRLNRLDLFDHLQPLGS